MSQGIAVLCALAQTPREVFKKSLESDPLFTYAPKWMAPLAIYAPIIGPLGLLAWYGRQTTKKEKKS